MQKNKTYDLGHGAWPLAWTCNLHTKIDAETFLFPSEHPGSTRILNILRIGRGFFARSWHVHRYIMCCSCTVRHLLCQIIKHRFAIQPTCNAIISCIRKNAVWYIYHYTASSRVFHWDTGIFALAPSTHSSSWSFLFYLQTRKFFSQHLKFCTHSSYWVRLLFPKYALHAWYCGFIKIVPRVVVLQASCSIASLFNLMKGHFDRSPKNVTHYRTPSN